MGSALICMHTYVVLKMVKENPDIRRSRLYNSAQDASRVDELARRGLIAGATEGYVLTQAGEGA